MTNKNFKNTGLNDGVLGVALLRMDSVLGPICEWSFSRNNWKMKESFNSPKELVRLYMISKMAVIPEAIEFANVATILNEIKKDQLLICFIDKNEVKDYKFIRKRLRIISGKAKGNKKRLINSLEKIKSDCS